MAIDLKHEIGLRVRAARKMRRATQAALAEAFDMSFATVSNVERGAWKDGPKFQHFEQHRTRLKWSSSSSSTINLTAGQSSATAYSVNSAPQREISMMRNWR